MGNTEEISQQPHELNHILRKYDKAQSGENREVLGNILREFKDSKGGQHTKNYTRDEFYEYLKPRLNEMGDKESK